MSNLTTGVKIKTSASIHAIEGLLEKICTGDWDVSIESIASDLSKKEVAVFFETEEDKLAFKNAYRTL